MVSGHLRESCDRDVTYFHNTNWSKTNMIRSLLEADDWLTKDNCIVSYADIAYFPQPIHDLVQVEDDIAITYDPNWLDLWSRRFCAPLEDAETFRLNGNYLTEIGAKTSNLDKIDGQFMGLIKFSPRGWDYVKFHLEKLKAVKLENLDTTSLLQGLILDGLAIRVVPVNSPWAEVDGALDLELYNKDPYLSLQWRKALAQ